MNDTQPEIPLVGYSLSVQSVARFSRIRTHLADAASYWEPMQMIYNGVLAVLVLACWGFDIVSSEPGQWLGAALVLMIFAGIANDLYCRAYPIDLAFQMVPFIQRRKKFRWLHDYHQSDLTVYDYGDVAIVTSSWEMDYEQSGQRSREAGKDQFVLHRRGTQWQAVWRAVTFEAAS